MLRTDNHMPSWANSISARLNQAATQPNSGAAQGELEIQRLEVDAEDATLGLWAQRDQFVQFRRRDEDPAWDQAMEQPGRVVTAEGHQALFEGTFIEGRLTVSSADGKEFTQAAFNGTAGTVLTLRQEGPSTLAHYDLANPQSSFELRLGAQATIPVSPSPYAGVMGSASEALSGIPEGAEERLLASVFLDGSRAMPEVRQQMLERLQAGLDGLAEKGFDQGALAELKKRLQAPDAKTPRQLTQGLADLALQNPRSSELTALRDTAGLWQVLEDFPKLQADGLTRTSELYVSPGHLQMATLSQGWDLDSESGLPVADTVVVGGGPGGLSTAYHLSEKGKRTVLFEGGSAGQGFSDANAQSVHQLRTNGNTSNLIYVGSDAQLGIDVSMPRHLVETRAQAKGARQSWEQSTGQPMQGISRAKEDDRANPANRAELFAHMGQVAQGLVEHYPDTFVCEKSPVTGIEKVERGDQTLFKVTTDKGHQIMARSLVMATGFVGGYGEHARSLGQFTELQQQHSQVTVLSNDHDLFTRNDDLLKLNQGLKEGRVERTIVASERLLGRPELRQAIKHLPPGSRIAMIGGGESATKGALEVLSYNPGVSVDLYTNGQLEPYQTQIPTKVIAPAVVEKSIEDPRIAQRTLEELKSFGTPITADTVASLLEHEQTGRVRIYEMGQRFEASSVEVAPAQTERGIGLSLKVVSQEVRQNLQAQRAAWTEAGLYTQKAPELPPGELPQADMVLVAAGYDRRSLQAGPLIQQLVDQGLVELNRGEPVVGADGLTSSKQPMLAFNTAGASGQAADSAIPARAVRAYRLAQALDQRLPEREIPSDRVASKLPFGGVDTVTEREQFRWETSRVENLIDNGGFSDQALAEKEALIATLTDPVERQLYQGWWQAERQFPAVNTTVRTLVARASEAPESLSPVEKIMVERAQQFSQRISPELHQ